MVVDVVIGLAALIGANYAKSGALQEADLRICYFCVGNFAIAFFYFMLRYPDKLRSERHTQVSEALKIAEAKGTIGDVDLADLIDDQKEPPRRSRPKR